MGTYEPLNYVCDDGNLTISGVAMRCPAWAVTDLAPLWLPPVLRGNSRITPGAAGVIANPKRATITRRSLVLVLTGGFDRFGMAYASEWVGIKANLDYLIANVFNPPTLPLVTRDAVLTEPDATTSTASVLATDLTPVRKVQAVHVYTFELEIPAGRFV